MSDGDINPGISMHKIACPDCGEDFYTEIPEGLKNSESVRSDTTCPACDTLSKLEYSESDGADVMFTVELLELEHPESDQDNAQ